MIDRILPAILIGTLWAVVHYSEPYKFIINKLGFGGIKLLNCVTCSGYWISLIFLMCQNFDYWSILYAAVGSVTANEINKRLYAI
jgi:hypothetical protein